MGELSYAKVNQAKAYIERVRADLKTSEIKESSSKHTLMPYEERRDTPLNDTRCTPNAEEIETELNKYEYLLNREQSKLKWLARGNHFAFACVIAIVLCYQYIPSGYICYLIALFLAIPLAIIGIKIQLNYSFGIMEARMEKDLSDKLCK